MAAGIPTTLVTVLDVVGPRIFKYLTEKDILCRLQYVSSDVHRSCSMAAETWRDFARRYCLGKIMRDSIALKINPLRPVVLTQSNLTHLAEKTKQKTEYIHEEPRCAQ